MILSKSKQSWHWWVAVSHKMDLKEIRSSDFIINLDTLHFFWPIFIFRTENALGRRGPSPTTDKGFLKHKTTKNFFSLKPFFHRCHTFGMRGPGITFFKRRKYKTFILCTYSGWKQKSSPLRSGSCKGQSWYKSCSYKFWKLW